MISNRIMMIIRKVVSFMVILMILVVGCICPVGVSAATNNITYSGNDSTASGSLQQYRILVKLKGDAAAKIESLINQKSMEISKESSKHMRSFFEKYKIKKMSPVYKDLVDWKKTGKTESDYFKKIQKAFPKRAERSPQALKPVEISSTYVIDADVNSKEEFEQELQALKKDPNVEYAEPDLVFTTQMLPNDPYFSSEGTWGQPYSDLYGVKTISCPEAWDVAKGNGVTVAVVDTGLDSTHPDISSNTWRNKEEIPDNGVDDDSNGYIDDTWGWDYVNNDNQPVDDQGHGTHVAGTIAASGNNSIGVIGVAPEAKIMPVKVCDSFGRCSTPNLASGILYAANNGADIINLSLSVSDSSTAIHQAIDTATRMGVVVVAAAGNNDSNAAMSCPANIDSVITVAATDASDQRAYFSNWGRCIDVAAPGVDILSLRATGVPGNDLVGEQYCRKSGTSMASPHVAGVAALILSLHPEFSYDKVTSLIRDSAIDFSPAGFDILTGYGRVNAVRALQYCDLLPGEIIVILNKTSTSIAAGQSERLAAKVITADIPNKNVTWSVTNQSAVNVAAVAQDGTVTATAPGTAVIRVASQEDPSRYAECTVTVTNPIAVTGVELNKSAVNIAVGQTEQLAATVLPADATNKSVTWSVSSQSTTNAVIVTNDGIITAITPGTAVIRASSQEDQSKYAECTVTVTASKQRFLLYEGFESGNGDVPGWAVQDVSGTEGEWSFVSKGTNPEVNAPHSGSQMAAFNSYSASSGSQSSLYSTSGIALGNGTYQLSFWMYHDSANVNSIDYIYLKVSTDKGSSWQYMNTNFFYRCSYEQGWKKHTISLDQYKGTKDLQIAFIGLGMQGNNMYIDDISIIGTEAITGVNLNKAATSMTVGQTEQLAATVLPTDATNKSVTWSISSESTTNAVIVTNDGIITAITPGTAIIRASSQEDPSKYAECTVTVTAPVTEVNLNKAATSMKVGQAEQLIATVLPTDATNKSVTWSVSNQSTSNVAKVAQDGTVTAVNPGTAVIRAASQEDPSKYAECTVTVTVPVPVTVPVTEVNLNKAATSMMVGQTEQLIATVLPADATNKSVTWSISSESTTNAVIVTNDGIITAITPGTAIIRASSQEDQNKYAECTVTVTASEQRFLLYEGFESSNGGIPDGWTVQNVNRTEGEWSFVSKGTNPEVNAPHSGTKMAAFNSNSAYPGSKSGLYRTSAIALGNGTYELSFWMFHDTGDRYSMDNIQVLMSADKGYNFSSEMILRSDGSTGWKKHTISLNKYKGTNDLQISFVAESKLGNNMYIDDISITGTETSDMEAITGVNLNNAAISMTVGQTEHLIATVLPIDATNKSVTWSVSSQSTTSAAIVAQDGTVTAVNPGTAVIRATSQKDPSKYAECTVTVTAPQQGVLVYEGFESSNGGVPNGWTVQNINGTDGVWSFVSKETNPEVNAPNSNKIT